VLVPDDPVTLAGLVDDVSSGEVAVSTHPPGLECGLEFGGRVACDTVEDRLGRDRFGTDDRVVVPGFDTPLLRPVGVLVAERRVRAGVIDSPHVVFGR
jgi:hypothetical protein